MILLGEIKIKDVEGICWKCGKETLKLFTFDVSPVTESFQCICSNCGCEGVMTGWSPEEAIAFHDPMICRENLVQRKKIIYDEFAEKYRNILFELSFLDETIKEIGVEQ